MDFELQSHNSVLQPDVAFPLQPPEVFNCSTRKASFSLMHNLLHDEIDYFCKQVQARFIFFKHFLQDLHVKFVFGFYSFELKFPFIYGCCEIIDYLYDMMKSKVAAENMARKPYINWAVKRVTRSLQVLWPRSRTNVFGSNATGLSLPSSDVDLVVCLPPVRNLVSMSGSNMLSITSSPCTYVYTGRLIFRYLFQEPIKEAGILEGRNGIKETCLQVRS